jgi:epoxyqueuosine reductase QueG
MQEIFEIITQLEQTSPSNRLVELDNRFIFDEPLIGVADGYDNLFMRYKKEIIGNFYLTPEELMLDEAQQRGMPFQKGAISVICWILPFQEHIKKANARRELIPAIKWAHGKEYGERLNNEIRRAVVQHYTDRGILACAPALSPLWRRIRLPDNILSNWSERHAMYAAGLGTFSLNDGFITEKGMAMRCGSVVVNAALPVTERTYTDHRANCLFISKGTCGKCMERCPASAITAKGHDKIQCKTFRDKFYGEYLHDTIGMDFYVDACGFCQTGTPCESANPMKNCQ